MTGRTRYGDLLHDAAARIGAAEWLLAAERLPGPLAGLHAAHAYRDLLQAAHRHGWHLLGGDARLAALRSAGRVDPRDAAAVRFLDATGAVARRSVGGGVSSPRSGPIAEAWAAAAYRLRLASDLLATHRDPGGVARGPAAALLDQPAVRAVGLGALARATTVVAGAADPLALRLRETGVSWPRVRRLVPRTADLLAASELLHRLCSGSSGAAGELASLEVARPPLRTDHPVHELADRLARLHRGAWQLARTRDVGVACLLDYAALGVVLHGHTAALLGTQGATDAEMTPDGPAARAIGPIERAGAAWKETYRRLRGLRTATPGSPALHGDLMRVRDLMRDLAPPPATGGAATAGTIDRLLLATLNGGVRSLGDIAGWNAHVLDDLAARGQLYVSAATVTGDQVADREALVPAKLHRRVVRVPPVQISALRDCYQTVRASTSSVMNPGQPAWGLPRGRTTAPDPP